MAKVRSCIVVILTISCLLVMSIPDVYARKQGPVAEEDANFSRDMCQLGKEKMVHLHFFVQDLGVNAPNTTTYDVAEASITATSPTSFGQVRVFDDLVTAEADADSKVLGRLQGINTKSGLSEFAITVHFNIYFTAGKYANSTLTILGRNPFFPAARELSVVGGTGAFRLTRGYVIQSTHSMQANVVVLEFNIYTTTYNYKAKSLEHDDM